MAIDDFWQHKVMKDSNTPPANLKTSSRKIQVKKSGIHGKGVFAARDIAKGETLIELPDGVLWRGQTHAPAYAIAEAHHLHNWLNHSWDCDCYDCFPEE